MNHLLWCYDAFHANILIYKNYIVNPSEVEILYVEDNLADADLGIRALKKCGIINNLVHLTDGQSALDYIFYRGKYAGRPITWQKKLILLDLNLPVVNGLDVLGTIRNDERTKNIPVIIMTVSKDEEHLKECFRLGVNSYLLKPVEFNKFRSEISKLEFNWQLISRTSEI